METWAIVLIIITAILVVTGLGVGIYFATRSGSSGGGNNGGDNGEPGSPGAQTCDALFQKVISQKTFSDAARVASLEVPDLPKDSNNHLTGCTVPGSDVQLYVYNTAWTANKGSITNGVTTTCNDLVVQMLGMNPNCNIAYAQLIQRYPAYLKTCNPVATEFIDLWASGKCPPVTQNSRRSKLR